MCLAALSTGSAAMAAQDFATYGQASSALSVQNAQSIPQASLVAQHARLVRRLDALAAQHLVRLRRERAADRQQAQAAAAQAQQQQAATPVAPAQPSYNSQTVAVGGFEACVISRESGGNPTAINPASGASGLFGFLLTTWMSTPEGASYPGGAYTAPASVQEQAFAWVYARDGVAPWRPYDGC